MTNSNTHNERIAKMTFASVYPLYLAKVEKKGRTKEELNQVIQWLTGFNNKQQQELNKKQQKLNLPRRVQVGHNHNANFPFIPKFPTFRHRYSN